MCDPPVMLRQRVTYGNWKNRIDLADELQRADSSLQVDNISEVLKSSTSCIKSNNPYPYRIQLERDVQRLQQQLQEEMDMHAILENAIEKNAMKLSSPSCLPHHARELLSTITVLEVTNSELEKEIISLHFQLSQERNERRLAEYRMRQSASQSISVCSSDGTKAAVTSPKSPNHSDSEPCHSAEDDRTSESTGETSCNQSLIEDAKETMLLHAKEVLLQANAKPVHEKEVLLQTDAKPAEAVDFMKHPKGIPPKGLWDYPNQLSEEMVRCMKNIFMSLADSTIQSKSSTLEGQLSPVSPQGHLSSNSSWRSSSERSMFSSWVQSPQVDIQSNCDVLALDDVFDPYRVRGKLSWADIGNYSLATEVSWMSVGKMQLEYASGALRKFRTLVEQLAKVNPLHMSCNERLAFWINLYNALIMHAYLAYGVPRSDLKLFSLMQKATYTVGGHSYSAAAIEYVILKMKPPLHRPQIALLLALHKLRVSEEQRKSAIDAYEPLVMFALSCGAYSSPAVRVFTAKNVIEELEEAQQDFIRASVGVSNKGKLLVPKMLHCFAKAYVDDANLAVWISHYLPPNQATFVEQCISQRRQSLLASRNCGILPFDSRFRYLFLPDKIFL